MKQKLNLPFAAPETVCYPHVTFAHCILKGNMGEGFDALMCERYLNCCYRKEPSNRRFHNCVADHWSTARGVVDYQKVGFLKQVWLAHGLRIETVLKASLGEGAYPFGQCPRYVVEPLCEDRSAEFDFAITGYDDEKGCFFVKGFDLDDVYHDYEIPYVVFEQAILQSRHKGVNFDLWSYHEGADATLDVAKVCRELSDYLNSTGSGGVRADNKYFGVEAIEALIADFDAAAGRGECLNAVYLRGFAEHKYFMGKIVTHLAEKRLISAIHRESADHVATLGWEVLALGEEYNQTCDACVAQQLLDKMRDTLAVERQYLPKVLEQLQNIDQ